MYTFTHLVLPPVNEGFQVRQGERGDGEDDGDAADDAGDDQELAHRDHHDLERTRVSLHSKYTLYMWYWNIYASISPH